MTNFWLGKYKKKSVTHFAFNEFLLVYLFAQKNSHVCKWLTAAELSEVKICIHPTETTACLSMVCLESGSVEVLQIKTCGKKCLFKQSWHRFQFNDFVHVEMFSMHAVKTFQSCASIRTAILLDFDLLSHFSVMTVFSLQSLAYFLPSCWPLLGPINSQVCVLVFFPQV